MIALALGWGCHTDSSNAPVESGAGAPLLLKAAPNTGCTTSSGQLSPSGGLILTSSSSQAIYGAGLVSASRTVTFGICNLDTTGTGMRPKAQVFGPESNFQFGGRVLAKVSYSDAGLSPADPNNPSYMLFRESEVSGRWEYYGMPTLRHTYIEYKIRKNGTYALGLGAGVSTGSGLVNSSTEAILNVLNSELAVPPGAISDPVVVQFTIADVMPEGLSNAFSKVYEYGPDSTQFLTTVISRVAFVDAEIGNTDPYLVHFYYFDETLNTWVPHVPAASVDTVNQRFEVQLNHFSRYAFGR